MSKRIASLTPRASLWLERGGVPVLTEEGAKILRAVHESRSLTEAGRAAGVSYAHAWSNIRRSERLLSARIVDTFRGGSRGGGGANLTSLGVTLLSRHEHLKAAIDEVLKQPPRGVARGAGFLGLQEHFDLVVAGSHCVGIDLITNELRQRDPQLRCGVMAVGSTAGLAAVGLGDADIAGVHLLHAESGEYNVPFIKALGLSGRVSLIRGYNRQQGLLVKHSNPKKIRSFKHLLQSNVKVVNRKPGTGTRQLFERLLQLESAALNLTPDVAAEKIRGYGFEVASHTEAAEAISAGKADVALGIHAVAETFGLDFIPVAEEKFDFAVATGRLAKKPIRAFADILRSTRFKSMLLKNAPGCTPVEDTGAVVYPPHFNW